MTVAAIKDIARDLGIKPGKMVKAQLIQAVQEAEGNFPCFGTAADGHCDQLDCRWRTDCLPQQRDL
jgi:hypothetical protein